MENLSVGLWLVRFWAKTALFRFQQTVQFSHKFIELLLVLLFLNPFAEIFDALDFFGSHLALRFLRNHDGSGHREIQFLLPAYSNSLIESNSLPMKTHCSRCFR